MPRTWLYYIALLIPLIANLVFMHTRVAVEWLWYNGYADYYMVINALSAHPQVIEYFGGWPLPVFLVTVFIHWTNDDLDEDDIANQFLLLPLAYVPFLIIGNAAVAGSFDPLTLYRYPLVAVPAGYLYILPWAFFIWTFKKFRLVV